MQLNNLVAMERFGIISDIIELLTSLRVLLVSNVRYEKEGIYRIVDVEDAVGFGRETAKFSQCVSHMND
jgi:hypothetical protein